MATLPKRQFDPEKVAQNVTMSLKVKPFTHEDHEFEDLLQLVESFGQAFNWSKVNFNPDNFERFQEFRNRKLETIPLDLLRTDDKPMPNVTINSEGPNS